MASALALVDASHVADVQLGLSIVMGLPQKWLVYNGKSHLNLDDLGVRLF